MFRSQFAAVLGCCLAVCTAAQAEEPIRALLVTGGCCHDYEHQKQIITAGISQRANVTWDVIHEGGTARDYKVSVYSQPDWAAKYDVIVHNECFGGVEDPEFVKAIVAAHQNGVHAIFIHCALHSYRTAGAGADAWRELIGVTSRSHEKHRPVKVVNLAEKHPVMTDFPAVWDTPNGELYKIEKVWPNCTPLAQAFGEDTQLDHTVIWTNSLGKAKVFGTSLGHHNETMNNDLWLGLVARGMLWTCGKLNDDGTPAEGYSGTGIKPITLPGLEPTADPVSKKKSS